MILWLIAGLSLLFADAAGACYWAEGFAETLIFLCLTAPTGLLFTLLAIESLK